MRTANADNRVWVAATTAGQSISTIPCGGHYHDSALSAALASLKSPANACADVVDACPESHPCAEAVETLAAFYSDCDIAHDDEDAAFQSLEAADGPCMVHAEHAAHDNHDDHDEAAASKSKPWGEAMGAAALVNIVTLAGVALCVPVVAKSIEAFPKYYEVVGTSFAGGALLSTAVFLLLYESNHLIPITEKQTEGMAAAIWGSMVLLGALPLHVQPPPILPRGTSPARVHTLHRHPPPAQRWTSHSLFHTHTPLPLPPSHSTASAHPPPPPPTKVYPIRHCRGLGYAHMRGDDRVRVHACGSTAERVSRMCHSHTVCLSRCRLFGVVVRGPGRARRAHPAQDAT